MTRIARIVAVAAMGLLLSMAFVACGDDDDDGDSPSGGASPGVTRPAGAATSAGQPTPASGTTPATGTTPTAGANQEISITAADFSFSPAAVTASAGAATISLQNGGQAQHTVHLYEDNAYTQLVGDTDVVSPGQNREFTATLEAATTYFFRCDIHKQAMQGTLTVQ